MSFGPLTRHATKMAIDFQSHLKRLRRGPTAPAPLQPQSPGGINFDEHLARLRSQPAQRGQIFSGGTVSDILDTLQIPNYAVAGVVSGKGIRRGVQERTTFEEVLAQQGMQPGVVRTLVGLALDIGLDPTTYLGIGALGKIPGVSRAAGVVGRVGKTAAAKVGLAFTPTQEAALKIVDEALRKEGVAAEKTADLVTAIQQSAAQMARGNVRQATLYRKALGGYFDAGADSLLADARMRETFGRTMLQRSPDELVQIRRQVAEAGQQNYLGALPGDVRGFVERWAPVVREAEENLLDNLVRVGRISEQTAGQWRGFHLRPLYAKFDESEKFVEFLRGTNPAQAVEMLSKMEHGAAFRSGAARGIPSEVGKQRKLLSTERGLLGEVPEADLRIAASHPIYQQAIVRGEMLQALARDYARPDFEKFINAPGADKFYRRMPETEKWGALSGKIVPKEIHDLITLKLDDPTAWERAIGWWKARKVVDNPATHGRNIRSMLTQQVPAAIGLRAFDPRVWVDSILDIAKNRELFQEAKGVASWAYDLFTARERIKVARKLDEAKTIGDYFVAPFRAYHSFMARAYNFEDLVGRQAIYRVLRGRKITPEAAALAADQAMINYRRIPPLLEKARRKGVYPFVAWPYGVVTQVIPRALQRPGQSFAGLKAIRAFTEPFTPEEERALPRYMRTGGYVKLGDHVLALLPWLKDRTGRPVAYDLTYELMFGDIAEQGTPLRALAVLTGRADPKEFATLLTPFGQLVAELSWNYSSFTGGKIQQPEEPITKRLLHGARALAPGSIFDVAETAAARTGALEQVGLTPVSELARSVTGTPTSTGKLPPSVPAALSRTLAGTKTIPIDVPAERRMRQIELRREVADIDQRIRSVKRSRALSEPLRRQRLLELRQQRRNIIETFKREGVVPAQP